MLIDLKFDSEDGSLRVPKINLHLFQGMLYNLLPVAFAQFLHDTGFETEKRRFKLFAFSWPRGKGKPVFMDNHLVFKTPLRITISTPIKETVSGITDGALGKSSVRIGNSTLFCSGILTRNPLVEREEINLYTLSPITCYSTLYKKTGDTFERIAFANFISARRHLRIHTSKRFHCVQEAHSLIITYFPKIWRFGFGSAQVPHTRSPQSSLPPIRSREPSAAVLLALGDGIVPTTP